MPEPKILVDSFPPCLTCGNRVSSARYRSHERDVEVLGFSLWRRSSSAVLLRPCGHVLTGDTATIWVSAAHWHCPEREEVDG